jgi:hypothetical protein
MAVMLLVTIPVRSPKRRLEIVSRRIISSPARVPSRIAS